MILPRGPAVLTEILTITQSITALAHLRAAVLYIVDISEQCGHTIQQQAALFHSIKPLFAGKPLLIVLNKIDVTPMDSLSEEDKATLNDMALEALKTSSAGQPLEVCTRTYTSEEAFVHIVLQHLFPRYILSSTTNFACPLEKC